MIQQRDVTGIVALNYVRQELSRGNILSDCINELPLDNGIIYAFVPPGTYENALYNFGSGGLYPSDETILNEGSSSMPIENDARPLVVELIQSYLSSKGSNCCLFEDQLRSPRDPVAIASKLDYVHLSGKMFYFFNYHRNDPSTIKKALIASEAHVFLCVLSSLDNTIQKDFLPNCEIRLDTLKKFSAGATSFFINAYDHEGFLMWVKKE